MKYYAVIDTNVLVSAMLKWNSVPGNVMELVFSDTIVPLLNEQIVKEYRDVLSRPKFHFTEKIIENVISEINRLGLYIDAEKTNVILPDPKDTVFYKIFFVKNEKKLAILIITIVSILILAAMIQIVLLIMGVWDLSQSIYTNNYNISKYNDSMVVFRKIIE